MSLCHRLYGISNYNLRVNDPSPLQSPEQSSYKSEAEVSVGQVAKV